MIRNSALLAFIFLATLAARSTQAKPVTGPPIDDRRAELAVPLWTPGSAPTEGRTLRFESIPRVFPGGKIQLSNGLAVVNAKDWRAVAMAPDTGNGPCTLTLVGPRVALLAAHCVDAGLAPTAPGLSTIPAEVVFDKHVYDLGCEMSPGYRKSLVNPLGSPRASDDFALCDVTRRGGNQSPLNEVAPQSLSTDVDLSSGTSIQMMGFGCTNLGISQDGRYTYDRADGTLNMGVEKIDATNISIHPATSGIYFRTLSSDGGPVLCPGDSGGPAMITAQSGGLRVVAVNSAMGATSAATAQRPAFYSYLSPLGTPTFRTFLKDWVEQRSLLPGTARKDRRVCGFGIAPGNGGCRP